MQVILRRGIRRVDDNFSARYRACINFYRRRGELIGRCTYRGKSNGKRATRRDERGEETRRVQSYLAMSKKDFRNMPFSRHKLKSATSRSLPISTHLALPSFAAPSFMTANTLHTVWPIPS